MAAKDTNQDELPGFWDIGPFDFGPGSERLSEEIDDIAYGNDSRPRQAGGKHSA